MSDLVRSLMRLAALALSVDEAFFDDKVDRSIGTMRLNYYPGQAAPPSPGQLRAGAHTDYGGVTILSGEDGPGGVQVRTRAGGRVDVAPPPPPLLVNLRDLPIRWATHRGLSHMHPTVDTPPGARQRLDVFPGGTPGAPTLAFTPGGYGQTNDKDPLSYVGESPLPAGFTPVLVEYTLAPAARLDAIVAEVRAAMAWTIEHAKEFGGDPGRVFVAGHSPGRPPPATAMTDTRRARGPAPSAPSHAQATPLS